MECKYKYFTIWETGQRTDQQGLPKQEDSIFPPAGDDDSPAGLFIVCDGMGGHADGDVASQTVVDALSAYILDVERTDGLDFTRGDLQQALTAAYRALDRRDNGAPDDRKMGTTLALLKLCAAGYIIAHIGDSRVYHIRPGADGDSTRLIHVTEDHSLVNHLVRKGEMTPEEALTSPQRHYITRAMQPNMPKRCNADVYCGDDLQPGDYFMLCSDGMLEHLSDDNIRAIFSHAGGNDRNKLSLLRRAVRDNQDNHSALVVHITGVADDNAINRSIDPQRRQAQKQSQAMNTKQKAAQATEALGRKTREFVATHKDDVLHGSAWIKLAAGVMAVMAVVMMVYYLFIRSNETLQTAGTAEIQGVPRIEQHETFGYEITEQDRRNEAQPIAPEMEEVDPDDIIGGDEPETPAETVEPAETEPSAPAPSDEPILQE